MSINLKKGQKINLKKDTQVLEKIIIGLGWDAKKAQGGFFGKLFNVDIDCDASAILLENGKFMDNSDIVYFGNLKHKSNAVFHSGDNLTGKGDGDDEQITINLKELPEKYDKLVVVANIYQAKNRNQHFGMIENAFIRVIDGKTNTEICKFSLTEDYSQSIALIFGEIYKYNGEWKFNPIGQGTNDNSISELIARYK